MLRISSLLLIALLSFSTDSYAENSSLHQWYEFYQQKLKTDQEAALHLLNQRYSALSPSGEKLYVSGLLFGYLSQRNQPYYGGSQRSDSEFAQQEALYIDALLNRKNSEYDLAIDKFTTLLRDKNTNNYIEKKELFLYQLCYTLNEQGELHKAKHFCSKLQQQIDNNDSTLLPKYLSYRIIANNFSYRGEPHLALANYQKMLRTLPDNADRSGAFNDIGNQLREVSQFQQSENYLLDALAIRRNASTPTELAQVLHSLAQLYADWHKHEQAESYYQQALALLRKDQHTFGLAMTYSGLGSLYIEQEEFAKGKELLNQALNEANLGQNHRLSAEIHYRFSLAYLKVGELQASLSHADQAYQSAVSMDFLSLQAKASLQLSETYKALADFPRAYECYHRYAEIEFRLRDKDTTSALEALDLAQQQFEYQLRIAQLQSDNDKKLIELQNYQQKKSLYSLLIAAALIVVGLFFLTSQQKRKQSQLDMMTGALNRGSAIKAIKQASSAKRPHSKNVLILFDLDNFKWVNDQFGHPTGDKLLITICKTLLGELQRGDILGRLGGEEFILLLREVEDIDVQFRVEKLHDLISECRVASPSNTAVSTSASFSFLATPRALSDFDELYSILDQALYQAKKNGRNTIIDAYNAAI
ncbi:diguanylate cyclase [Vibrio sp. 05-20-BW147]|uniref:diguanylate cyclase n=1 Tax=Vibrio sp. 05-20-BW147 TaxID=2575834 RepID=UPI001593B786|nr:diguanylate cyclase [Vibrio sp. 05-20-BW147]NVC65058.1 diguanylate cyclase [Vibrio sp. 05-20-BW147]